MFEIVLSQPTFKVLSLPVLKITYRQIVNAIKRISDFVIGKIFMNDIMTIPFETFVDLIIVSFAFW